VSLVSGGERRVRTDIQVLRGIAVTAVILFHSGLGVMPSGYLGVDMFFVVSGFLIGGIIIREAGERRFSFVDFYIRRIRRLLPAAYTVLLVSLLLAIALLTSSAFERFWPQFAGSLVFSTNIMLWRQINYFNNSAAFEPLLHMWSLAVEEQFYLIFPMALLVLPRRLWPTAIATATVASLAAYGWLYPRSPGVAFYLLPTRAWELGIGVLATFAAAAPRWRRGARLLFPAAVLAIVAVCFAPGNVVGSYWLAVPACLATAIVIIAGHNGSTARVMLAPVARIGDISYSLYLVHWPLFAFAHCVYLTEDLPVWLSAGIIVATVALALALYSFVEEPIRRSAARPALVVTTAIVASILLLSAGAAVLHVKRREAPRIDLTGVTGLALPSCTGDGASIDTRCSQSATPDILIWGDSLSQAITPGIDATTDHPIIEASKGQCAPLLGIAPVDRDATATFARSCIAFNDSVVAYLAKTPSVKVVILTGRYFRLLQDGTRAMIRDANGTSIGTAGFDPMLAAQVRTTAALRKLGKRVVVIADPPQASFDVGACWERVRTGLPTIVPGAAANVPVCAIAGSGALGLAPEGRQLMTAFENDAATPVIRLDQMMCSGAICPTAWNGVPLYRDGAHVSRTGSILIGRRLGLGALALSAAR